VVDESAPYETITVEDAPGVVAPTQTPAVAGEVPT